MKSIMFVCLGNICRSPIAQGCAEKLVKQHSLDLHVNSSGTGDWHIGEHPCENSIKVCKQNNVDISQYTSSQFTKKDITSYDLVIALDEQNLKDLKSIGVKNVVKLGNYGFDGEDVPDPYFFDGFEGFDKVFSMIEECVENLLKQEGFIDN